MVDDAILRATGDGEPSPGQRIGRRCCKDELKMRGWGREKVSQDFIHIHGTGATLLRAQECLHEAIP